MRKINLCQWLIVLGSIVNPIVTQAQSTSENLSTVLDQIDYAYFHKHLSYLASDELEGRGIGSDGYTKAAKYVATEFNENGLLPFGDQGSFSQAVALTKPAMQDLTFNFQFENKHNSIIAGYGENISFILSPKHVKIEEKLKMVFVGYGNILHSENINDYQNIDVQGKLVIVALGGPKSLEHPAFNNRLVKIKNAHDQRASGIILFYPNADLFQNLIFKGAHEFLSEHILHLADTTIKGSKTDIDLKIASFAKKSLIKEIFKLNDLNLKKELQKIEKGERWAYELQSEVNCSYEVIMNDIMSTNVIGLLPGSDPILKNEYVVISAHLDHYGIGKAVKGDSIYNGMWDNASGTAALISLTKAFKNLNESPERSIIFACLTAEESGLLGSNYFVNKNNIRNGKIVANINVDMLGSLFETKDFTPLGYSHSTLSKAADFAAKTLGLRVNDNKLIETKYIERSDQYSFINNGIPSLHMAGGNDAIDPKIKGEKYFNQWMKKDYHSPFDDLNQDYSDQAFLTAIKVNFLTLYYASSILKEIEWNQDSWLYKKYVTKEAIDESRNE